jgi:acetyl esterase/lipase
VSRETDILRVPTAFNISGAELMTGQMSARCLFIFLCLSPALCAQDAIPSSTKKNSFAKTVYTYKTVDKVRIKADVYRHGNAEDRPVIVWLHGGALIMGTREGVPKQLLDLARKEHYVVVSLGYRLAPQAKLSQIIEDLTDGISWVRKSGPRLFHANPSRMVVAGASAGGYLALMTGHTAQPAPTALVSYWGFGDVDGDWTTTPSDAYRKGKLIDRDVALAGVGKDVLTSTNKQTGRGRSTYFLYLKQTGRWVNEVSGLDPKKNREQLTQYCPVRNVSPSFPPTLFLHGTADKDVPVEQSIAMAAELKRHGVPHELITVKGGGHSLWGGDRKKIDAAFARSMAYIHEHLSDAKSR